MNICPNCDCQGGTVRYTNPGGLTTNFESTIVKPASCISRAGGTILVVSGEGIATNFGNITPATFHLTLVDQSSLFPIDVANILIEYLDNNGQYLSELVGFNPLEGSLMIAECPGE